MDQAAAAPAIPCRLVGLGLQPREVGSRVQRAPGGGGGASVLQLPVPYKSGRELCDLGILGPET